jgi:signal transduction histidine kinase
MHRLLDALASGVHDTKNQLFIAEAIIAACEKKHGVELGEARYALEAAANRLSRTLATYHLLRHDARLAILPVIVGDLCAEVALNQRQHLAKAGISLEITCTVVDVWAFDRDLVSDMLNNAVQNASRFARRQIRLIAQTEDGGLLLRVEDDGPGFTILPPASGTGLLIAERLASMHTRLGRNGHVRLANDSTLGGARVDMWLP